MALRNTVGEKKKDGSKERVESIKKRSSHGNLAG